MSLSLKITEKNMSMNECINLRFEVQEGLCIEGLSPECVRWELKNVSASKTMNVRSRSLIFLLNLTVVQYKLN